MSDTPATDTSASDDSTQDLAALLAEEMARPSIQASDEPSAPLKLDTEPTWLRDARQAIEGTMDHGVLNSIVARYMREPEDRKVLIRPILAAQRARIDAAEETAQREATVARAAARFAQLPPEAIAYCAANGADEWCQAEPSAVRLEVVRLCKAHTTAAATPARGAAVVAATAAVAATAPSAADAVTPATAQIDARPMVATWRRIEGGPHHGTWGACVEHLQYGVAIEPPRPGDVVLVNRARGGNTQPKRITGIALMSGARGGYSICTVADPAPGERGALARPRTAAPVASAPVAAPVAAEPAANTADLAEALGTVATEAAANAAVADLGAQSTSAESSAQGQRLGVGFSTWQQYAEALRRGGLQPATRTEYIATVRRMGGTIDESTLPPANVSSALPVGSGITHTPTGPSYFDRPRAERQGLKVGKAAQEVRSGAALLKAGDLIGWLDPHSGAGGDFSWAGKGQITRAALLATLTEINREGDAPAAKEARAQAGRAVDTLRPLGYHVHAVQGTERKSLPAYVAHRYIVGRALVQDAAAGIGEEYGKRVLVVDLHQDDTMHCTGDEGLASKVKADFEARCASDIYISADLTTWLQRTLRNVHGATRFGVGWYVPAGQREAAEQLTRAVAKIWGESWRHGMPVAACSHLFESIVEGLSDELVKLEEAWAGAQEEAREARRERVGAAKAGGLLARIFEANERVRGYAVLLGDEIVAPLRARLATLDGAIRPLVDDTTARASMLEFS